MSELLSQPDTLVKPVDESSVGRFAKVGALVAGDALSFALFAAEGLRAHDKTSSANLLLDVLWTAVPFAAGWFFVSPWLGVYKRELTTGVVRMLKRTELAWLCSWPLALVLRWALSADHKIPLSFALVILVANAVFLGAWRSAFVLVASWLGRRKQS